MAGPMDLAFAFLCHRLRLLSREARDTGVSHVPMEAFTRDREAFISLVRSLTGLALDEGYL
ncbi:MAG: hypothetical protein QGG40_14110, partial [Myxococcota bacterium]|nr:hypothetical protein [Myxococcota bacterium]